MSNVGDSNPIKILVTYFYCPFAASAGGELQHLRGPGGIWEASVCVQSGCCGVGGRDSASNRGTWQVCEQEAQLQSRVQSPSSERTGYFCY